MHRPEHIWIYSFVFFYIHRSMVFPQVSAFFHLIYSGNLSKSAHTDPLLCCGMEATLFIYTVLGVFRFSRSFAIIKTGAVNVCMNMNLCSPLIFCSSLLLFITKFYKEHFRCTFVSIHDFLIMNSNRWISGLEDKHVLNLNLLSKKIKAILFIPEIYENSSNSCPQKLLFKNR